MGSKAFKRRLVHSVVVAIPAWNNFAVLLKVVANVLKWRAFLKTKIKCVCVAIYSLVMGLFSRDLLKAEID